MRFFLLLLPFLGAGNQFSIAQGNSSQNWAEVKQFRKGTIEVYWFESRPFVYRQFNGKISGVEYELMEGFKTFLLENYAIDLTINWIEAKSFSNVIDTIRRKKQNGIFGASALSITPERDNLVDFTPPYISDISVLISNKKLPIVKNIQEFDSLFTKLTAITIKQTTYETDILKMRDDRGFSFKIKYISSAENILQQVAKTDSSFGFIDLPIYLTYLKKNPAINVERQNLFPVKRNGYAFIMPENSDWAAIMKAYFESERFKIQLEKIISKFLDLEVYHFIESMAIYTATSDEIALLTKEKQIQYQSLIGKEAEIKKESEMLHYMIIFISAIFLSFIIIFILYRRLMIDHKKLKNQKLKIEIQSQNIEQQNIQLENRNKRLNSLNEEKNNLIKILAHDLRSPISHVEGIAQLLLLKGNDFTEEEKAKHLTLIMNASKRLSKMISNVLDIDAIENERVNIFLERINVTETTQHIIDSFERQLQNKNITAHFLPFESICFINADMLLYTEIIENLLSNAIKFSPRDKSIIVSVKNEAGWVVISIKDEGPGLSNEDKLLIFKKFQKLSARPTGGEPSTGLGLSIVKKYTELMYGQISYYSVLGEGTRFSVKFEEAESV